MFAILAVLSAPVSARGAGHPDATVIPLGPGWAEKGVHPDSWRLPNGPDGPVPQAVVVVASQPKLAQLEGPVAPVPRGETPPQAQVPATIRFTIAGQTLPEWKLFEFPSAYIINQEIIRKNPDFAGGRLALSIDTRTEADGVILSVYGMPDPGLLNDTLNGPLAAFVQAADDPAVRAYFEALAWEIGGEKVKARIEYEKLANSENRRLARFARRGLRLLSYELRPHALSGNFREHYYWGLFLQQCSLFGPAYTEFNEARTIYRNHADSQFRAGEMFERMAAGPFQVMDYMERSGEANFQAAPSEWTALLIIDRGEGNDRLSAMDAFELKGQWITMQYMVWAATGGTIVPVVSILELPSDEMVYVEYPGGLLAPPPEIVARRGYFDGVFVVRPRQPDESRARVRTIGGDRGPNGAALSVLQFIPTWQEFMRAWYQQMAWAAQVCEPGPGIPSADYVLDCGHQPIPSPAYGYRAALRYHWSPAMYRRVKIAPPLAPGEYVRTWRIEGPFPVSSGAVAGGRSSSEGTSPQMDANAEVVKTNGDPPGRHSDSTGGSGGAETADMPSMGPGHLHDPLPETAPRTIRLFGDEDYIDLARHLGTPGPALARATCWVYSPDDQEARLWLGQNDGAAIWVNGRCVHTGRVFLANNFADRTMVDTVASYAPLKRGWNELRLVCEALGSPHDRGWGFSVRLCDWNNEPLVGLAYLNAPPADGNVVPPDVREIGRHYSWSQAKRDFAGVLPRLDEESLARLTGLSDLHLTGQVGEPGGYAAITVAGRPASRIYRSLDEPWQAGGDGDWRLNNVLDWQREACMALRYEKEDRPRDLLFVKPEGVKTYLKLLDEPDSAKQLFGDDKPWDRLLGYVEIPGAQSSRILFVIDCLLAETEDWPMDEEDLLQPIPDDYIPNPTHVFPTVGHWREALEQQQMQRQSSSDLSPLQ